MYKCPKCQYDLIKIENHYQCENRHSFDISKEGYVNLLLKNSINHGDNKAMVVARTNFLNKNYYLPMLQTVLDIIKQYPNATILDLGCGEGYYTNKLQAALPNATIIGVDISKEAIKHAAKSNKCVNYIIASNADLPLGDNSIDVAICLFSFVDFQEAHRILKANGILIVVSPHQYHLYELKELIYDTPYLNKIEVREQAYLELVDNLEKTYTFDINNNQDIRELFNMTPYSYKTKARDKEKLNAIEKLRLHASFQILTYKKTTIK